VRAVQRGFPRGNRKCVRQLAARTLIAIAVLTGPLAPSGWADPTETAQNEIRSALEKWRSAFNQRDSDRVCELFAPDIVANYRGQPERDYSSLCDLLHATLQDEQKTYHYLLKINEILVYGETAIARLIWTLEIDTADKPRELIEEPSLDIFHRQADGSWKISRYLAYSSVP
jgi:ketosteroid isomerase-like protein